MSQQEISKAKHQIEKARKKNLQRMDLREKISKTPQVVTESPQEEVKDQEKPL